MVWPRRYMSWGPRSSARPSTLAPANTSWEPSQNPMKSRDNLCNQETVMPQWPSEMDSFDCIPGPSTIPTSQVTGDSIIQTPLSLGLSQLSPIDPTLTNYSAYPYPGSESPQSQQQTQIPKFYLEASGVQQMGQIYKIHGTSIPVTVTPDYHSSINESAIEALRLVDRPLPREILKHTRPTDQRRYVQFELILGGRTFPVSAMVKKGSDLSISLSHNSELANILNPALGCFLQTNLTTNAPHQEVTWSSTTLQTSNGQIRPPENVAAFDQSSWTPSLTVGSTVGSTDVFIPSPSTEAAMSQTGLYDSGPCDFGPCDFGSHDIGPQAEYTPKDNPQPYTQGYRPGNQNFSSGDAGL